MFSRRACFQLVSLHLRPTFFSFNALRYARTSLQLTVRPEAVEHPVFLFLLFRTKFRCNDNGIDTEGLKALAANFKRKLLRLLTSIAIRRIVQ